MAQQDIFQRIKERMHSDLGRYAPFYGYFTFPKLEGPIGPRMIFNGKEVICWSINNYLGLANHPEVRKVDAEAAQRWGLAYPMGSRLMSGHTALHEQLEKALADFLQKEDAFLLNYGYQGMLSIIPALTDRKDVIIYDSSSHACIVDGVNISFARRFVYAHNDINQLEDRLKKAQRIVRRTKGGILVITEGVFGMHGDLGKLDEIVSLKDRYDFRLLVDDAHGFGVMGPNGRGVAEHFGVQDKVDLIFGTFAKSMAGIGAFVAGDKYVIDFLRHHTRSQIFAKSLPMAMVEGALKRLELLRERKELREQLWKIVNAIQQGLKQRGFDIGKTQSAVTPVFMKGEEVEAANMIIDLRENYRIFVSGVIYPVVEKGTVLIRIIPTAAHTLKEVEETLAAFEDVRPKLEKGYYKGALWLEKYHSLS